MTLLLKLHQLPDTIIGFVVDYLSFEDAHGLLCCTCHSLRDRSQATLQSSITKTKSVQLTSTRELSIFQNIFLLQHHATQNIIRLDLGQYGTDDFLHTLADTENSLLPNLQSISLVNSQDVTDRGLLSLSKGISRQQNLQYIDLTYCYKTTYDGTFPLRDNLQNLKLLRRQPKWFDGQYETPFSNDGLHTYYADGSFSFERERDSRGYVIQIKPWDNNPSSYFVHTKLQFSNFVPPGTWPTWTKYSYRPGVSILKLKKSANNEDDTNDSSINEVLVGQNLRETKPSPNYPLPQHLAYLPQPKSSCYFDRYGNLLNNDRDDEPLRRHYMVSRMRVLPLQSVMPPPELVEQNRLFCQQYKQRVRGELNLDLEAAGD